MNNKNIDSKSESTRLKHLKGQVTMLLCTDVDANRVNFIVTLSYLSFLVWTC